MNLASSFYTNVVEYKGKLLIRGVNNGQSYLSRINYSPTLYLPTKEQSKAKCGLLPANRVPGYPQICFPGQGRGTEKKKGE